LRTVGARGEQVLVNIALLAIDIPVVPLISMIAFLLADLAIVSPRLWFETNVRCVRDCHWSDRFPQKRKRLSTTHSEENFALSSKNRVKARPFSNRRPNRYYSNRTFSMKKNQSPESGGFNPRAFLAFILCSIGASLATAVVLASGFGSAGTSTGFTTQVSTTATAATPAIAFEVPSVADPIHTWGEPSIAVDPSPNARVSVSGPTGTGTQRSAWEDSVDGGHTFRVITPGVVPTEFQSIEDPPGGGDTDINFDHTGKQYFIDLYALTCDRVATTSDGGATVMQSFLGCGTNPGSDRPWLAAYEPPATITPTSAYTGPTPLIYDVYNNLVGPGPNGGSQWNKSTDGLNYTNATNGVPTVADEVNYSPFGPDCYPAIDQQTGKVFQAAGFPTNAGKYNLLLNIGTPDVLGNLTFLDIPTLQTAPGPNYGNLIHVAGNLPGDPDTLFTVLSMDTARNLFVVWAISPSSGSPGQRQVFVSAASAASGWRSWTTPVQVSDGKTSSGDAVNVFPWIKAGGPGRADAVWYGSDKNVDPSSNNGQKWNVFMNQVVFPTNPITGAITGAAPSTTLVKVTPHPMHYDGICLLGTGCITQQGNRNLADFFSITIDPSGAAEIVYDDTSNGLVQPGFTPDNQQLADHAGAPLVSVARQSSGMGLYGTSVSGPSNAPVAGISDPSGDAKYPVIGGTNVPGMDIVGSSMNLSADRSTLNVIMNVVDLSNPALTSTELAAAPLLQYVTRWQMGNTIYYAAMTNTAAGQPLFYAGKAQSVDLCSVSACFPHVLTYGEPTLGGTQETGTLQCPATPSTTTPCTITVKVNVADVGGPTATSLLEEVAGYAFAASHPQGATTNAQALADNVPLEIDGTPPYNFEAAVNNGGLPLCHEADANGDLHGNGNGDDKKFKVEEDQCEHDQGDGGGGPDVTFSDPSAGVNFASTQTQSLVFNDATHTMTASGTGLDNGKPVTFVAVAVDNGATSLDTFSLTLSDGYSAGGNLVDGSVNLR
jgi:hypothetical protein